MACRPTGNRVAFRCGAILRHINHLRLPRRALQVTLLAASPANRFASTLGIYRHATMSEWSAYGTRYTHSFPPRLYRVADPSMRLLRREDLATTFIVPSSLSFTLHIPDRVSAFNPAPNWQDELSSILGHVD